MVPLEPRWALSLVGLWAPRGQPHGGTPYPGMAGPAPVQMKLDPGRLLALPCGAVKSVENGANRNRERTQTIKGLCQGKGQRTAGGLGPRTGRAASATAAVCTCMLSYTHKCVCVRVLVPSSLHLPCPLRFYQ